MSEHPSQSGDSPPENLEERVRERLGSELEGVGTLREVVGIGGMATVYGARTPSGESVAVKLMHEHLADKGSLRRRFLREAEILDQVDHPNAVAVFDRGDTGQGEAYFVMELLDGWEVETVWKNKSREFPVREALEIAAQGLDCLHAYHRAEVLHRDLKPSNLFLTRDGVVKLIDFGVARFRNQTSQRTRAGTALGTPAYMAPEQAMGKVEILDARTDVYGFGAVLFTLLSGRRVHEADNNDETLVMAATQPADSLARHAPDVPTDVVRVVDRALSWDPEDRYQSADRMRATLQNLLEESAGDLQRDDAAAAVDVDPPDRALEREAADVVVDIDETSLEGMRVMFDRLEQALGAAGIYEWEHDKTIQSFEHAYEAFRETIDRDGGEVYWKVRPHSFEVDGDPLWNPEDSFELVPYHLFLDGFRRIQLRSSMDLDEFVSFARWLTLDPHTDLPPEDDLATALWDLDLESVDGKVVTAPAMIDPDRDGLLLDEVDGDLMERAESTLEEGAGEKLLVAMRTGAYAEAEAVREDADSAPDRSRNLGRDFTVAERGLVGADRLEQLSRAVERAPDHWESRVERVIADVWRRGVDLEADAQFAASMRDLIVLYLDSGRPEPLLRVLIRSFRNLEHPSGRSFFLRHVLDDESVRSLTETLRDEVAPERDAEGDDGSKILDLFGHLLGLLPETRFDVLAEEFTVDHGPVRRAVAQYLRRHADGRERSLAERLPELEPEARETLLRIIATTGSEEAFEILADKLTDGDPHLRRRVVALLNDHFDLSSGRYDLSEQLEALLDDPNETLRLAALRLAREMRADALVPAVAERASGSEFDTLSTDERREILQTLAVLSRSRAREVACDLAEEYGVIPDENRQRTRVLALRILGEIGESERALEAVESGEGGWWWNSDTVRKAAERAHEQIARRMDADS